MALTSQLSTSVLQVDGRANEGGVIEIVPGARLLLDVGVDSVEGGALLDEIATAVAEAQAARDEAVDISGISTSDAVIASRIETPGTATQTALSATIGAEVEPLRSTEVTANLSTSNTAVQNYDALTAAATEATAARKALRLPAGSFDCYSPTGTPLLDLESETGLLHVYGAGMDATTLRQTNPASDGIWVARTANVRRAARFAHFTLAGPQSGIGIGARFGNASTTKVAVNPTLDHVRVCDFGSHGLRTEYVDGLRMTASHIQTNSRGATVAHNWFCGQATNYFSLDGCKFGAAGYTAPVGSACIYFEDPDVGVLDGCELSYWDTGVVVAPGTGRHVSFNGSRFEALNTRHVIGGDGVGTQPVGFAFRECEFMGDGVLTKLVSLQGTNGWIFEQCSGINLPAGGVFVKDESGLSNKAQVVNCTVNGGANVVQTRTSANSSDQRIIIGGDYTNLVASPFGDTMRPHAATLSASGTYNLGVCTRTSQKIVGVYLLTGTTLAFNATNYWSVEVRRSANGTDQGVVASTSTASTTLTANRQTTMTLGAQTTMQAGNTYHLVVTKNGTPVDLTDVLVTVAWQPS